MCSNKLIALCWYRALRSCFICSITSTVNGVSLVFGAMILLLMTSISGLIAEHVTLKVDLLNLQNISVHLVQTLRH